MYEQAYVRYEHVVSFATTLGGYKRFTLEGRDTLRKVGLHDIKRSPVLASYRNFTGYVMGIYFGVTPLGVIP
jgi:hypothetical protein